MDYFALYLLYGFPIRTIETERCLYISEYMLGETILVAPVITAGATTRNVYLPRGNWTDGNTGTRYTGARWINNYPAPLTVLPYFIKIS